MTSYGKARDEFIKVAQRNGINRESARRFLRLANSHARIQVAICNGPGDYVNRVPYPRAGEIYAEHEVLCARREERVEKQIKRLAEECNVKVDCGGDPRGFTVKLFLPDGSYNSWGGKESGYGVPTRE